MADQARDALLAPGNTANTTIDMNTTVNVDGAPSSSSSATPPCPSRDSAFVIEGVQDCEEPRDVPESKCHSPHLLVLIFSLAVWGGAIWILCVHLSGEWDTYDSHGRTSIWILYAIAWLMHLALALNDGTKKYLDSIVSVDECYGYVREALEAVPSLAVSVDSYHSECQFEICGCRQREVVTNSESRTLSIMSWRDLSRGTGLGELKQCRNLCVRIFAPTFSLVDKETLDAYKQLHAQMKAIGKAADSNIRMKTSFFAPQVAYKEHMLILANPGELPCGVTSSMYGFFALFALEYPLCLMFDCATRKHDVFLHKQISVIPYTDPSFSACGMHPKLLHPNPANPLAGPAGQSIAVPVGNMVQAPGSDGEAFHEPPTAYQQLK